jgi:hypothetical protein
VRAQLKAETYNSGFEVIYEVVESGIKVIFVFDFTSSEGADEIGLSEMVGSVEKYDLLLVFELISTLIQRVGQGRGGKREDSGS